MASKSALIAISVCVGVIVLAVAAVVALVSFRPPPDVETSIVIRPDVEELTLPHGKAFNLSCFWTGLDVDKKRLRWSDPNGTDVAEGPGDPSTAIVYEALQLQFYRPSSKNSGNYTCRGFHENKLYKKRVKIHFRGAEPQFEAGFVELNFTEGLNVSIPCSAFGEEPIRYQWFDPKRKEIPTLGIERIVAEDGSLRILEAEVGHSGNYTCRASNRHGSAEKTFKVSIVRASPPTFEAGYEDVIGYEGFDVKLSCQPFGPQPMTFTWYDPRQERIGGLSRYEVNTTTTGSSLTIRVVQKSDAGYYRCVAANSHGQSAMSFSLAVEFGSPKFDTGYKNVSITAGSAFQLHCKAAGVKPMRYTWYDPRDDIIESRLNLSSIYVHSSNHESTLVVKAASSSQAGLFTCTAKNARGLASLVFEVTVAGELIKRGSL